MEKTNIHVSSACAQRLIFSYFGSNNLRFKHVFIIFFSNLVFAISEQITHRIKSISTVKKIVFNVLFNTKRVLVPFCDTDYIDGDDVDSERQQLPQGASSVCFILILFPQFSNPVFRYFRTPRQFSLLYEKDIYNHDILQNKLIKRILTTEFISLENPYEKNVKLIPCVQCVTIFYYNLNHNRVTILIRIFCRNEGL